MAINSIRLQNFRSYTDDSFEFEPGVNIIVGPNASGKTNLIESIMVSCLGNSYKGRDIDLMMHDKDWSRIDTSDEDNNDRTIKLQLSSQKPKKTIEINGQKSVRMPASKRVPFILFEPNHLLMFHGGPELRREFMDNLLSQANPSFATVLRQYRRSLLQRNSLLKSSHYQKVGKEELFVWNLRLSDIGGAVASERLKLIEKMNQELPGIYSQLSNYNSEIKIEYKSACHPDQYASSMLKRLESNLSEDLARGFTTVGPHRDDMEIYLNGYNVKESASRGEIRTIVLTCKIFEQSYIQQTTEQKPIFLLDDVFSELDGARRRSLTEFLQEHQVFITTTDADVVVQHFTDTCKVIALNRPDS